MPRTPEQNRIVKDRRKSKITEKALKIFANMDYRDVSVDTITKAVRCSHGLFYHYFDSKEDIFNYIIDEIVLENSSLFPIEKANEIGGTKGLKILTSHYSSLINATNHDLYCLKIMLDLIDVSEIPSNLKKIVKENDLKKCLISLIKTSQEEGNAIAGDPTSIAKAMTLLIKEEIKTNMNEKGKNSLPSGDILLGMMMKKPLSEI